MMDGIMNELLEEAYSSVITASAQAIRSSIGNLPLPIDSVEIFISAESERLGALLRHDMQMWILRLKHDALHPAANPGPVVTVEEIVTPPVYLGPHPRRYEVIGPMKREGLKWIERGAIEDWHGEPRRADESQIQFERRVLREIERG
jgi:hypothetical protein